MATGPTTRAAGDDISVRPRRFTQRYREARRIAQAMRKNRLHEIFAKPSRTSTVAGDGPAVETRIGSG